MAIDDSHDDEDDIHNAYEDMAHGFGQNTDPLVDLEPTFKHQLGMEPFDPFEITLAKLVDPQNPHPKTRRKYERTFEQWCEWMDRHDRFPACPNEHHVERWILQYLKGERDNASKTAYGKLRLLNKAFQFWQNDSHFPHSNDFNPFGLVMERITLEQDEEKEPPRIPLDELRAKVGGITNIRDRAFPITQLKLGLRATELCNIKISELHIKKSPLRDYYPEMGTHSALDGRKNAIYIPPSLNSSFPVEGRQGNKSKRPRVLPLDDEMQHVLLQWLLIRPDVDRPWLFLSKSNHSRLDDGDINDVWKDCFHPEYAETEMYDAVTSHFGRHYFSTYWRIHEDQNEELVQYMRGDKNGGNNGGQQGLDHYLHTYFEDIRDVYIDNIYKLNV